MPKALVIFNPVSGNKKLRDPRKIIQTVLEEEGWSYDWFDTIPAPKQPLEPFAKKKYDRIVVAGGDGTVAEVCSFLIRHQIKTPLAILPQGSANVLAVSLKLPLDLRRATRVGLRGKGRMLDAMRINEIHYGMIAAGCGYDTLVMRKTSREMKRKIGALAYFWTILKTIFWYRSQPYKLTIDGQRHTVSAKSILVFNILPLGHLRLTRPILKKKVLPDDGLLNIYVLDPRPIRDWLRPGRGLKVFQGKSISIKSRKKRHFQIDGDVFEGKTLQIEAMARAVRVVGDR